LLVFLSAQRPEKRKNHFRHVADLVGAAADHADVSLAALLLCDSLLLPSSFIHSLKQPAQQAAIGTPGLLQPADLLWG
jgi:hypothetical protein